MRNVRKHKRLPAPITGFYFALLFFVVISCQNSTQTGSEKKETVDSLKKPVSPVEQIVDKKSAEPFIDTVLNGIVLRNAASTEKILGRDIEFTEDTNLVDEDFPHHYVICNNKTALLTLFFHYGDGKNQVSEFKVEQLHGDRVIFKNFAAHKLNDKDFVSGKGVRLGLTKIELMRLLGIPTLITALEGDKTKFSYKQKNGLYYADYFFEKRALIKFRFGNIYP
ncbi:MAG: hypothetical protein IAF38_20895 [Bacteroidia bacterium]|nr:hypothetical protein [Bacteroidia bacterium]